jgi:hypothetical protein
MGSSYQQLRRAFLGRSDVISALEDVSVIGGILGLLMPHLDSLV